jgi:hypothetical protein
MAFFVLGWCQLFQLSNQTKNKKKTQMRSIEAFVLEPNPT